MYAKIFEQIFDSSIAEDHQTRHIFMDLLVLADQTGIVDMTTEAIARRTNVPIELIDNAMEALLAPDPHSRNHENEGRRIIPIDPDRGWGWQIVNFEQYHKMKDESARREYMRTYMRKRRADKANVNTALTPVNTSKQQLAHTDTDADIDKDADIEEKEVTSANADSSTPFDSIVDQWNDVCGSNGCPRVRTVTEARKKHMRTRWKQPGFREAYAEVLKKVTESPFLSGGDGKWRAPFDWLMKSPENWIKVMEGNYAASPPKPSHGPDAQIPGVYYDANGDPHLDPNVCAYDEEFVEQVEREIYADMQAEAIRMDSELAHGS